MKKLSVSLSALLTVAILLCTAGVIPAKAADDGVIVSSLSELQTAISAADDGAVIYISEDIEITEDTSIGSELHSVSIAAVEGKYVTISISEDFPPDQCVYFSNLVFMGGNNSGILCPHQQPEPRALDFPQIAERVFLPARRTVPAVQQPVHNKQFLCVLVIADDAMTMLQPIQNIGDLVSLQSGFCSNSLDADLVAAAEVGVWICYAVEVDVPIFRCEVVSYPRA